MKACLDFVPGSAKSSFLVLSILASAMSGRSQELPSPRAAEETAAMQPIRSDWMASNGVNGSMNPNDVWANELEDRMQMGPFTAHLNGQASVIYNDNIYLSGSNRTSDMISTISPEIIIGVGDYIWQKDNWLSIDYSPSLILFADHQHNDTVDQDGNLNFQWVLPSLTFHLTQEYRRLSGPIVEAAARVGRSVYDTSISLKYALDDKTSFDLEASQSIDVYDNPLPSFNQWNLTAWASIWMMPKVRVSVGSSATYLEIEDQPSQSYQQALLRFEYDMMEFVTIQGTIGGEIREFQSGRSNKFNGVFDLGATLQPVANCTLLLDAYRRDEPSLVEASENYTTDGLSATVSENLGEMFSLSAAGGYNHSDYYGTASGVEGAGSYAYWFIRPSVSYKLHSQITLELFYQFQESSSGDARGFENNITGVNASYHF